MSTPISIIGFNTDNTPLQNSDRIKEGEPVHLTEYQALADWNYQNEDMTVVAVYGGEYGLPRADFRPVIGKMVRILEIPADGDPDNSRAHRFTQKAFAELYKKGCRTCEALVWNTSEELDFAVLEREAYAGGYLKQDDNEEERELAFEEFLKWATVTKKWPLIGRSFSTGTTSLIYAQSGCGKTMIELVKAVVLATGKSLDDQFLEYKAHGSRVQILYVQSEMSEADIRERLESIGDHLKIDCSKLIEWYKPQWSLCERAEQEAILKRLAELDPKGESKWLVVIDTVKSLMPEVLNGDGGKFSKCVSPWLRFLNDRGVSVDLLHHENKGGESSGPTTLGNLVDNVFHITRMNDCDLRIEATKKRTLTGDQCSPGYWHSRVDSKKRLQELWTKHLDGEANAVKETPADESESATSHPVDTEKAVQKADPASLDELRAYPEEDQRQILLALWSRLGSKEKVGESLQCSESSIENQMRSLGINKNVLADFTKAKMRQ